MPKEENYTLTVQELCEILHTLPQDAKVIYHNGVTQHNTLSVYVGDSLKEVFIDIGDIDDV